MEAFLGSLLNVKNTERLNRLEKNYYIIINILLFFILPSKKRKNFQNYYRRYNEYYTRYENVEDIFNRYIPEGTFKDKIIYSPCDNEESAFVKYITSHKEQLQYKEYIYTSDDYNTHLDIFNYADIIITNPPFSKLIKEFIPILLTVNKLYFIFGSKISLPAYYRILGNNCKYILPDTHFSFVCPREDLSPHVAYIYITNIPGVNNYSSTNLKKDNKNNKYLIVNTLDGPIRMYDKLRYIDINYKEDILVPCTILFEDNRKYFDIIGIYYEPTHLVDNKKRYARFLVKRNNVEFEE